MIFFIFFCFLMNFIFVHFSCKCFAKITFILFYHVFSNFLLFPFLACLTLIHFIHSLKWVLFPFSLFFVRHLNFHFDSIYVLFFNYSHFLFVSISISFITTLPCNSKFSLYFYLSFSSVNGTYLSWDNLKFFVTYTILLISLLSIFASFYFF